MITLNEYEIPSFVKVNKVDFSILPEMQNNLLNVRGKAGVYSFGPDVGTRSIKLSVTIIAEEINGVMELTRTLASWLYHKEPVKLVIADEPDKHYLVLLDGSTDISEIANIGQGTISFICTEPFAFGEERSYIFSPTSTDPFYFEVGGTAETFPEVELTIKEDITSIGLTSDDGYVLIGEPDSVTKTNKNLKPTVLNDHMENANAWSTTGQTDDGTALGTFTSTNGWGVSASGKNYGSSTAGWHGPTGIQALTKTAQDFEITVWFGFDAKKPQEVGRVELYLLDANNYSLGKIAMVDDSARTITPTFEARAGDRNSGHYITKYGGNSRMGYFTNWYGYMRLIRQGKKWTTDITRLVNGKQTHTYRKIWYDNGERYMNPLASVQIHIGAYKTNTPVDSMYISRVLVKEFLSKSDTDNPIVAEKGDVLLIDNANAQVYRNGELFYEGINPSSTFFKLNKGLNGLSLTSPVADVKVNYIERWL